MSSHSKNTLFSPDSQAVQPTSLPAGDGWALPGCVRVCDLHTAGPDRPDHSQAQKGSEGAFSLTVSGTENLENVGALISKEEKNKDNLKVSL